MGGLHAGQEGVQGLEGAQGPEHSVPPALPAAAAGALPESYQPASVNDVCEPLKLFSHHNVTHSMSDPVHANGAGDTGVLADTCTVAAIASH